MAEIDLTSGFENAVLVDGEPDRVYEAEDINTRYEGLVSSYGVYSNIDSACQVVANNGMSVVVKTGKGELNNHWFKIEADTELTIDAADVILNRIDSIVLRRTSTDRKIILTVKKGELATNPVAPTLTRTEEIQEIFLANVAVNKNATTITTSNITDLRPSNNYCGFIACLVEQLNTEELFNQYQAAQTEFISEKSTEFNNWFETIKDEVRSTSLYREYQSLYRTNVEYEQVITIPTSINYIHNSLDILNVYINGIKLSDGIQYTINSDGTTITLANPLELIGQDIEFVNKKSIDGTAAESVVVQLEALQEEVNSLENYTYVATGSGDNIILSNMVKNFLDGVGKYASALDNASMKINVVGRLGIDTLIDGQMQFDFNSSTSSNRKVVIDFANATIPTIASPTETIDIFAVFSMETNVTVENAIIGVVDINANTIYGFHGGVVKNCIANITISPDLKTKVYGAWDPWEISNSRILVVSDNEKYGVYAGRFILFNYVLATTSSSSSSAVSGYAIKTDNANGIVIGNSVTGAIQTGTSTVNLGNNTN